MNNVDETTVEGLCIGCGICKSVCPKQCIEYSEYKGLCVPQIDHSSCVECGRCLLVCPGYNVPYNRFDGIEKGSDFWFGRYRETWVAWSDDREVRHNAVSGGVITELVTHLLEDEYEVAFLVGTHEYGGERVRTHIYRKGDTLSRTSKSRYLTISQEDAVAYAIAHRDEKIILVGTGCFMHGFYKVIDSFSLNRENYFLIGLFCDKTMTGNVVRFFRRHKALRGKKMKELYFRTKDVGGWPGGVQAVTSNGQRISISNRERMKVKEYFQPERCLYCLDKLNMLSDISVGDNYTGVYSDSLGSNSVIIRTRRAENIWKRYRDYFVVNEIDKESIVKSQHLKSRVKNLSYARIKQRYIDHNINELPDDVDNPKLNIVTRLRYIIRRGKIAVGGCYKDAPYLLSICLLGRNMKNKIRTMMKG